VYEQVAIVYAGINGYLDDIEVEKVTAFTKGLREYLKTNKPEFAGIIKDKKVLTEDAEKLLKEALAEYKQTFLVSA
jgi:F-type H+-transporting ATPase subunit alpha